MLALLHNPNAPTICNFRQLPRQEVIWTRIFIHSAALKDKTLMRSSGGTHPLVNSSNEAGDEICLKHQTQWATQKSLNKPQIFIIFPKIFLSLLIHSVQKKDHFNLLHQYYQSQHILQTLLQSQPHNQRQLAWTWRFPPRHDCTNHSNVGLKKTYGSNLVHFCALKNSKIYLDHPSQRDV